MTRAHRRAFGRRPLLAGAALLPAAPALATTRTVTDALGREVVVGARPERVVVMFNYEEFTAVAGPEAWGRVVGMNRIVWEGWRPAIFSRYRAAIPRLAGLPDVGNTDEGTFAAEKVIGLRPDLLMMPAWAWTAAQTARQQIAAAGIPVLVFDYNAQTLERHVASTRAIGAAMGTPERAEALAERYRRNVGGILERAARASGGVKPRAYIELGQGGAEVVGNSYAPVTMWGRIFDLLGAFNIAEGRIPGSYGPIAAEAVLAADPQFIFIGASSWANRPRAVRTGYDVPPDVTRRSLDPYAARPGWGSLSAIRSGELHAIEHGLCRTLFDDTAMLYMAKRFWPGAFADADPVAALAEYHASFLPVPFSGTWMLPWRG
ncbi:ABC transporter substrate-binding protein [Neoroseomonas soli]|uniref:ABC transporter substrate-binding protein n=1 Tax=Neoroseomonas soli TaxID=1081025 RepID=A0A9X9X2W1_9PROT|nr:ABC transporter substrate-binding protein [Neoroseomonas soli]MBR0673740.1 ABC transporter substrate-binding protein [Neoroseomonas soli]